MINTVQGEKILGTITNEIPLIATTTQQGSKTCFTSCTTFTTILKLYLYYQVQETYSCPCIRVYNTVNNAVNWVIITAVNIAVNIAHNT